MQREGETHPRDKSMGSKEVLKESPATTKEEVRRPTQDEKLVIATLLARYRNIQKRIFEWAEDTTGTVPRTTDDIGEKYSTWTKEDFLSARKIFEESRVAEMAKQKAIRESAEKTRPTREEITKKAEEFVERMKGVRDHGEIHNQIVRWSRGGNFEESQRYYPGWGTEDFLSYAQEIKRRESESEWGTALYEV